MGEVLLIAGASAIAVLTILYSAAVAVRDERALHDLAVESHRLRAEFAERMRRKAQDAGFITEDDKPSDAEIVED